MIKPKKTYKRKKNNNYKETVKITDYDKERSITSLSTLAKLSDTGIDLGFLTIGSARYQLLNGMKLGVGNIQRASRIISIDKLHLRYVIKRDPVKVRIQDQVIRVVIIYDKQNNSLVSAVDTILYALEKDAVLRPSTVYDNVGEGVKDRYQILYDKIWYFPWTNVTQNGVVTQMNNLPGQQPLVEDCVLNFNPPLETGFYANLNSGLIGDINSGSIHLYCFTELDPDDAEIEINGLTRIFFKDINK